MSISSEDDTNPYPRWLSWLIYVYLLVIVAEAEVARRVRETFDRWVCNCEPHERFGTYVWHTHTFRFLRWRRRWLAHHSVLEDGTDYREIIPWGEMRDSDVQVRVYPAGSRIGEITDGE